MMFFILNLLKVKFKNKGIYDDCISFREGSNNKEK